MGEGVRGRAGVAERGTERITKCPGDLRLLVHLRLFISRRGNPDHLGRLFAYSQLRPQRILEPGPKSPSSVLRCAVAWTGVWCGQKMAWDLPVRCPSCSGRGAGASSCEHTAEFWGPPRWPGLAWEPGWPASVPRDPVPAVCSTVNGREAGLGPPLGTVDWG